MKDLELSQAFFNKGIKSANLAFHLLISGDLADYREASVREFFHCFELLLKSQIVKHNRYLLLQNTGDLSSSWGQKKFDEMQTKAANELPKLLYALEGGDSNFEFLKQNIKEIENMRTERNKSEHGAVPFTNGYVVLVIAPFFHKVICRLIDAIDPKGYKAYFDDETRIQLMDQSDKPEDLLPEPNRFFPNPRPCPDCFHHFAFVSKDSMNVHCLVCDKDVIQDTLTMYGRCPTCERQTLISSGFVRCVGECLMDFPAVKPMASNQGCKCGSDEIADLLEYTGSEEGLCLKCLNSVDLWACDFCNEYWTSESKEEPPEELGSSNLCENCSAHVWGVYNNPP